MKLSAGDVVVVPFPFREAVGAKMRPACDFIVCR